ncbi:MAG: glycosyltransferase family 1 protein [Woeseiaceae bacterium]
MSKMRVCINGMTENDQIRGPVRYVYEIAANLPTSKYEVYLIAGSWQKNIYVELESKINVRYYNVNRSKISRALFFMFYMPWFMHKYSIDVYHIPDTNPIPIFKGKTKIISTIHDCAEYVVPQRFSYVQAFYRRVISWSQAKLSDSIITVSHSSKDDIFKYLNVAYAKINVIYNGITKLTNDVSTSDADVSYILYVGVLEKEKNVERLVEAYALLDESIRCDTKLYLVGRKGNAFKEIQYMVDKYSLSEDVFIYGYVDDKELERLYKNAMIFAYLSEYEGFGLPILEAMQYGIPVLTTNNSSLKEIAGNAALLTDTCVDQIKNNLSLLLEDENKRDYFSHQGMCKAKEYSWEVAAINTGLQYEHLFQ